MQDLADLMSLTQRGYFVPPRPEKNAVESQRSTTDFLEGRRGALEKYLGKLAAHPVISHSAVRNRGHQDCSSSLCHFCRGFSITLCADVSFLHRRIFPLVPLPLLSDWAGSAQELRVFLECDGELVCSPEWNALKPSHSTILEGVAKLPKQIIGKDRLKCPAAWRAH